MLGPRSVRKFQIRVVYTALDMRTLPRIRITGDLEGAYVVLSKQPNGQLKIAPEQPKGLPRIVTLERTTWVCPTQWVATLADGRTVYARSRRGEFSVGVGDDLDDAVLKSMGAEALYFEYVEDSPMGFDELRAHLYGLLEFPADLSAEQFSIQASRGVLRHMTEDEEKAGISWEKFRPE